MMLRGRKGINGDVGLNEAEDKCQLKVEEESGGQERGQMFPRKPGAGVLERDRLRCDDGNVG